MDDLPPPVCQFGYTEAQVEEILGGQLNAFWRWMTGQTETVCSGRQYNHVTRLEEPSGCGPHGAIVFESDLRRFLRGRPVD